jgi:hypothetical protein
MCIELGYPKYFRCDKCGQYITKAETCSQRSGICTGPMAARTYGICGGSFTIEMTEEEYNAQLKEWEEIRNKNK